MSPQEILNRINDQVPDRSVDPMSLTPTEMAGFMALCGDALVDFIQAAQANIEPDQVILSQRKVAHIEAIFKELSDNFFPMAHTTAPLRHQRIHNETEIRLVGEMLHEAEVMFGNKFGEMHDQIRRIRRIYRDATDR
jgi:hypothetical protein